jgi:hypothetical protein
VRTLLCILTCLLMLAPRASQAACQSPYPLQTLARDLGLMQSSLRNLDEQGFRDAGTRLKQGLQCMEAPAPAAVYATTYRLLGALYHLEGDIDQSEAWFHTALELDPGFAWDVRDFDVGHPIRVSFEGIASKLDTTTVPVEGKKIRQPKTGRLIIDGRPLMEPEATLGRPHMVQQISADNKVVSTWVFEGNSFPEQLVKPDFDEPEEAGPALVIAEEPSKDKNRRKNKDKNREDDPVVDATPSPTPANPMDDVVMVERIRPPMKTPLLVMGGAGLLGAGGTYAASYLVRQRFEESTTTDEANQLRATTNALVLASGGVAVVGLGLGYWGVLLDGGYGIGVHGRF